MTGHRSRSLAAVLVPAMLVLAIGLLTLASGRGPAGAPRDLIGPAGMAAEPAVAQAKPGFDATRWFQHRNSKPHPDLLLAVLLAAAGALARTTRPGQRPAASPFLPLVARRQAVQLRAPPRPLAH